MLRKQLCFVYIYFNEMCLFRRAQKCYQKCICECRNSMLTNITRSTRILANEAHTKWEMYYIQDHAQTKLYHSLTANSCGHLNGSWEFAINGRYDCSGRNPVCILA